MMSVRLQGGIMGVLAIVCVCVFGKGVFFDFVAYDDLAFIVENEIINKGLTLDGLRWAFLYDSQVGELIHPGVENLWHPLTWVSHMIDVELFGVEEAGGHHAVSVLLYVVTSLFMMWTVGQITGRPWIAFWVALLWMIHPLKVESVAWISERKGILSGLYFWIALGCAVRSLKSRVGWYWIGYLTFILALLSKPSVVILPVLILLVEWYMGSAALTVSWLVKGVRKWLLWFISSAVMALITIYMQSGGSHEYFMAKSSLTGRIMTSGVGLFYYLWRILFPVNLNYEYAPPSIPSWAYALSLCIMVAVMAVSWQYRMRAKTWFFGLAWFLVCWLPVSGIIYVGISFTADRYLYIALAGLIIAGVSSLHQLCGRKMIYALIPLSLIWSALTWRQLEAWQDSWALFRNSTIAQPRVTSGWTNLGKLQQDAKQYEKAIHSYTKATEENPSSYIAWNNLGKCKELLDQREEAEVAYRRALEIYPDFLLPSRNLGLMLRNEGKLEEARSYFLHGNDKDISMMWLTCEMDLALGNLLRAESLLDRLEHEHIQNPHIQKKMKEARAFLNSKNGAETLER